MTSGGPDPMWSLLVACLLLMAVIVVMAVVLVAIGWIQ